MKGGQVALVTGASHSLSAGIAFKFESQSASVAVKYHKFATAANRGVADFLAPGTRMMSDRRSR